MLKITNDYYVDTDPRNWILYRRYVIEEKDLKKCKKAKVGDERFEAVGYYPTLESLLRHLLEKEKRAIAKLEPSLESYIKDLEHMQADYIASVKDCVSKVDVDARKEYIVKRGEKA